MTAEQREKNLIPQIDYYMSGGGTLFRAFCPTLDISFFADSPKKAFKALLMVVRQEINGILEGRGGPNDERVPVAEYLKDMIKRHHATSLNRLGEFFILLPGPGPFTPGLK